MPARRFSFSNRCVSKNGASRCELAAGHLCAHRAEEVEWIDLATKLLDVETDRL